MNKMFPVMLVLLFASHSAADTIYLNNGQSFRGELIRVNSREIVVTIGGLAEIDFKISTIDRVEDERGKVILKNGEVFVHDHSESDLSGYDAANIVYPYELDQTQSYRGATAALGKGSTSLGGLVSFSSFAGDINEGTYGIENEGRLTLFAITPSITYFFFDNIGIGADVMYRRERFQDHSEDQFSLGPRFTYAIPLESTFRPYLGAGIGFLQWSFSEEERAYSDIGMTAKVGMGAFYFVSEHYAANMEFTYKWDRFDPDLAVYPITGTALLFSIGFSGFIY